MADWRKHYGIPVYTAEKLPTKAFKAKILGVSPESIKDRQSGGEECKLHLVLEGHDLQIRLNKTNCTTLAKVWGDDTDEWEGKYVEVGRGKTKYNGKMVDCVEVKPLAK